MDYTTSIDNVVHSGTGHRMHSDSIAIPTAWSGNDANMVVWSLMEVLRLAGVSGKAFNPDDPASYTRFRDALVTTFAGLDSPAFRGSPQAPVPPLFDNTTRLATTSWYWNQIATGVNSAGKINGVNSPNLLFNGSGNLEVLAGDRQSSQVLKADSAKDRFFLTTRQSRAARVWETFPRRSQWELPRRSRLVASSRPPALLLAACM
ncbi:hypothetical protein [Burkholderia cenocepacia]|uniref:hypothetical protein n=1 Tax=Burkholderia cenocepacia TaxID=95486 RepID=UPI0020112D98|nr:hypothetical protein [Burkholderia cenocepacia]